MGDVISNVREHFLEDGVDEIVLQELKQLWQNKLAATKAVSENKETEKVVGESPKLFQDILFIIRNFYELKIIVTSIF